MFTASSVRADTYSWTNVQSDIPGVAGEISPRLVNPWGLASSSDDMIRVSDNGKGVSTVYHLSGKSPPTWVNIPPVTEDSKGSPTGIVYNNTPFFRVTKNGNMAPSTFIFASKDGTISGWSPVLDQFNAIVAVEGSQENVYMGLTIGTDATGHTYLYATNFHQNRVDVFNQNFHKVLTNRFIDPDTRAYAPFGIKYINGKVYVTYAEQDRDKRDVITGTGYVNEFNADGEFLKRLQQDTGISTSAPYGLAIVNDRLWVGNFGSGIINKFNPETGRFIETLRQRNGSPLIFDGLRDFLQIGVNVYFTAGIADEKHGLLGFITRDQP